MKFSVSRSVSLLRSVPRDPVTQAPVPKYGPALFHTHAPTDSAQISYEQKNSRQPATAHDFKQAELQGGSSGELEESRLRDEIDALRRRCEELRVQVQHDVDRRYIDETAVVQQSLDSQLQSVQDDLFLTLDRQRREHAITLADLERRYHAAQNSRTVSSAHDRRGPRASKWPQSDGGVQDRAPRIPPALRTSDALPTPVSSPDVPPRRAVLSHASEATENREAKARGLWSDAGGLGPLSSAPSEYDRKLGEKLEREERLASGGAPQHLPDRPARSIAWAEPLQTVLPAPAYSMSDPSSSSSNSIRVSDRPTGTVPLMSAPFTRGHPQTDPSFESDQLHFSDSISPSRERSSESSSPIRDVGRASMNTRRFSTGDLSSYVAQITVPEPFKFAEREEYRARMGIQSISQQRAQLDKVYRRSELEHQLRPHFRAAAPPPSTYGPTYLERAEKEYRVRELRQEERARQLLSSCQPFGAYEDSHALKERKEGSGAAEVALFSSRPIPDMIRQVADQDHHLLEMEQEKRRRRLIRARSEALLAKSRLPPRLHVWEQTVGKAHQHALQEAQSRAGLGPEHTFSPVIHASMPDYTKLYRNFAAGQDVRRIEVAPTIPRPFSGYDARTDRLRRVKDQRRERQARSSQKAQLSVPEPRWPFTKLSASTSSASPPRTSPSIQSPPPTTPKCYCGRRRSMRPLSSRKSSPGQSGGASGDTGPRADDGNTPCGICARKVYTQKKLEERKRLEEQQKRDAASRRQAEREMTKKVAPKVPPLQEQARQTIKEKVKSFKEAMDGVDAAWQHRVQEMQRRVEQQPFLFQRQGMLAAIQNAKRKFEDVLSSHGLAPVIDDTAAIGSGATGSSGVDLNKATEWAATRHQQASSAAEANQASAHDEYQDYAEADTYVAEQASPQTYSSYAEDQSDSLVSPSP